MPTPEVASEIVTVFSKRQPSIPFAAFGNAILCQGDFRCKVATNIEAWD